jgi:CheY-like chemotaxis protein
VAAILIIDDDTALLAACRIGLRGLGHEVRTASNGGDGIASAAVHPPDVVVLDLGLPDSDGVEVCRRLRDWTNTPIIILSADGPEDRKVEALNDGADDYVAKPLVCVNSTRGYASPFVAMPPRTRCFWLLARAQVHVGAAFDLSYVSAAKASLSSRSFRWLSSLCERTRGSAQLQPTYRTKS